MDLSTFSEMVDRFTASLTPKERELLEKRFVEPRAAFDFGQKRVPYQKHVTFPRVKRGRGQRKNRRDRMGRVKHVAHLLANALLGAARRGAETNLRLDRIA